ncbi:MAG TPA: ABC transporter ATP-binding protein, partial [Rhabdochlamydiaceae bacterium]
LDEPTNDLDIPTLETLEESLLDFPGAVVLITHDRCMLDRISNVLMALGDPECTDLYADYGQWEAAMKAKLPAPKVKEKKMDTAPPKPKLSYAEKKEYDQIERKIEKLEETVKELNHLLEQPEMATDPERLAEVCTAVGLTENQIEQLYLRWEELDKKQR